MGMYWAISESEIELYQPVQVFKYQTGQSPEEPGLTL